MEEDRLPNGSVAARLTDQGPGVQALLKRVAAAWLDRQRDGVHDKKEAIGRLAWNVGRRISGGLFDREAGWAVVAEELDDSEGAERPDVGRSFDAGGEKGVDVGRLRASMQVSEFNWHEGG